MRRALATALPLLLLAAGCTFEDGVGWATLSAEASGRLVVDEAHTPSGDATIETERRFTLAIDSLRATAARLELLEAVGGGGGGSDTFDPANPPPGYSLCHGGHCHTADGGIESYEEIEAKLAAGGDGATQRVAESHAVAGEVDLLGGAAVTLGRFETGTLNLAGVRLVLERVALTGRWIRADEEVALDVELAPGPGIGLTADASALIGRDGRESGRVTLSVTVTGDLFDNILLTHLTATDGVLLIDAGHNEPSYELLLTRAALWTATAEIED